MDDRGSILGPEDGLSVVDLDGKDTIIYVIPFDGNEAVFQSSKNEQVIFLQ